MEVDTVNRTGWWPVSVLTSLNRGQSVLSRNDMES